MEAIVRCENYVVHNQRHRQLNQTCHTRQNERSNRDGRAVGYAWRATSDRPTRFTPLGSLILTSYTRNKTLLSLGPPYILLYLTQSQPGIFTLLSHSIHLTSCTRNINAALSLPHNVSRSTLTRHIFRTAQKTLFQHVQADRPCSKCVVNEVLPRVL